MLASSVPSKFSVPWANSAPGTLIRPIPTTSQIGIVAGAASIPDGFVPLNETPVAAGGVPPDIRDANGIINQITQWNRWQAAGGPYFYDVNFALTITGYPSGATIQSTVTPAVFWVSTADNNSTNPDAGAAAFTGVISGTQLTVSGLTSGAISLGSVIVGAGVTANTVVTAFGTGSGGNGTYTVNNSQSVSSEAMTSTGSANWVSMFQAGGFTTGDYKWSAKTVADPTWIKHNDGTIGNTGSGATAFAGPQCQALYALYWNGFSNANCPVSSGRGANATADFLAGKTLQLPLALGRVHGTAGSGSGLTTRNLGDAVGAETQVISQAQLPSYNLSINSFSATINVSDSGHIHGTPTFNTGSWSGTFSTSYIVSSVNNQAGTFNIGNTATGNAAVSGSISGVSGTAASGGSGSPLSIVQPTSFLGNLFIKL